MPDFFQFMLRLCVALIGAMPAGICTAQTWPEKSVRVIVPFAPGGSADTLGRLVAQHLAARLKQSFVVENRAGAGGVIGSEQVAKAAPDGYTLLVSGVASHVIAPALGAAAFDPQRDFTHIALFGGPPIVLAVHPGLGVRDLNGFIALARSRPGELVYGSPGNGTNGHLVGEMLRQQAGIRISHAPYKGAAPAVGDILGNHIPAVSVTLATAGPHLRVGKILGIGLSSARRLADYPEVPTFAEAGYPELVATTWFSLSGPAGLPVEIVALLNAEVRRTLALAEVRERLRVEGTEPNDLDARAFADFVRTEVARWTPIARASAAGATGQGEARK